jgi:hypothetical protein
MASCRKNQAASCFFQFLAAVSVGALLRLDVLALLKFAAGLARLAGVKNKMLVGPKSRAAHFFLGTFYFSVAAWSKLVWLKAQPLFSAVSGGCHIAPNLLADAAWMAETEICCSSRVARRDKKIKTLETSDSRVTKMFTHIFLIISGAGTFRI